MGEPRFLFHRGKRSKEKRARSVAGGAALKRSAKEATSCRFADIGMFCAAPMVLPLKRRGAWTFSMNVSKAIRDYP